MGGEGRITDRSCCGRATSPRHWARPTGASSASTATPPKQRSPSSPVLPPPSRAGSSTGPVEAQNFVTEKIRRIAHGMRNFETACACRSTQASNGTLVQLLESGAVTHASSRRAGFVVASPAVLAFSSWGNRRACQRLARPLWLTSRTSSARSARPSARWSGSKPPHDLVGALPPDRGARFPRPRWRPAPLATDPNPPTGSTSDPRGASAGRRTRTACTCARRGGRRSRRGLGT